MHYWSVRSVCALETPEPVRGEDRKVSQRRMTGFGPSEYAVVFRPCYLARAKPESGTSITASVGQHGDSAFGQYSEAVADIVGESAGARRVHDYFEKQDGAWCGMHALNNYLGGP